MKFKSRQEVLLSKINSQLNEFNLAFNSELLAENSPDHAELVDLSCLFEGMKERLLDNFYGDNVSILVDLEHQYNCYLAA